MLLSLLLAAAAPVPAPVLAPASAPDRAQVPVQPAAPGQPIPMPVPAAAASTQPYAARSRPAIGFVSAAALRDRCESNAATLVSYCFAYITGVHDSVRAYETWLRFREFCPPYSSSQADLRRAFLGYLKANPAASTGEAASVVVLALKDQFACADPAQEEPKGEPGAQPSPRKR